MNDTARKRGLTGFHLKIMAAVSMLIDHVGAVLGGPMLQLAAGTDPTVYDGTRYALIGWVQQHWQLCGGLYDGLRLVGRLAFPIYCFLLIEGLRHTRSVRRYALRLGVFALISEIPFDLAVNGVWLESGSNNVFFTLTLGLLLAWGIRQAETDFRLRTHKGMTVALMALTAAIGAELLHCDYGAAGVLTMGLLYLLRNYPVGGGGASVLLLTQLTGNPREVFALAAVPLFGCYNGERGRPLKYFFYWFYPAHLLVLAAIRLWLLGV